MVLTGSIGHKGLNCIWHYTCQGPFTRRIYFQYAQFVLGLHAYSYKPLKWLTVELTLETCAGAVRECVYVLCHF